MLHNREVTANQKGFRRLETLSFESSTPRGARFLTQAGHLEVSFYAPGIIRLRLDTKPGVDYGLLVSSPEPMEVNLSAEGDRFRLEAQGVALELMPDPLRLRLRLDNEVVLESSTDRGVQGDLLIDPVTQADGRWSVALTLKSGEPVYGLGEKFSPLNHRGQLITSWNVDALGINTEESYKNTPFAWSPEGWGLFVHTPARVTHAVGYPQWSQRSYILGVEDPNLDIFLLAGATPPDILRMYTFLTGRSPLPPRWSYGVWMSRAYYRTAEEALNVARTLRERNIPCDVLVLDGRAWHKPEYRFDFKWDEERYPNPANFIKELKGLGIRLCLWEYPYISSHNPLFNQLAEKGYLLRTADGRPYIHKWFPEPFDTVIPHLQPSGIVDLTNPDAYNWYRDAHRDLFEIGVSAMKTDYGEAIPEDVIAYNGDTGKRLHNVYSLLYNRCVYEASEKYGQDGAIVWGRSGWAGSQRYPVQWGGDPSCDWEGLAASIRGSLSWGMSGAPFYSHDIGGFTGGMPDPELYVRWAQASVMSSHTRFHGTGPREPWEFGEEAEHIVRKWLEWHYRLIPYLEACALEAGRTGIPVMRAMPLAFSEDPLAWGFEEQYMLGPALLVAPIVRPGGKVRFYLPRGVWHNLWSEERAQGPRVLELTMPLDSIPVYGRKGFLLPLGPAVQHTGQLGTDTTIDEIWAFGTPEQGIELPGLLLQVETDRSQTILGNLPADTRVRQWGTVPTKRLSDSIIFSKESGKNDE